MERRSAARKANGGTVTLKKTGEHKNDKAKTRGGYDYRRLRRLDVRAAVYSALCFAALSALVITLVADNERPVAADGDFDYPTAYSAVSGTDAYLSPSDVAVRAESYLDQFYEFDRSYCFEYWMECQEILAQTEGYAPDEALTGRVRADYDRYVLIVRREAEEHRAFSEKIKLVVIFSALSVACIAMLAVNRLRAAMCLGNAPKPDRLPEEDDPEDGGGGE